MRLTLRTLLAYLDDTLEAAEIKEIGDKVAESDAAQELVARLKQVTRRRRLAAPATTGPDATDPNIVAEYLDNELPSDKVSELEKQALESDVHLAEIAACHQILTLVLGEPALVPPTAKERMYKLVQGREAIPNRKPQPVKKASKEPTVDDDDLTLNAGWLRWILPVAGVLLVVLLGVAIYQVLPDSPDKDKRVAINGGKSGNGKDNGDKGGPIEKDKDAEKGKEKEPVTPVPPDKEKEKEKEKEPVTPVPPDKEKEKEKEKEKTKPKPGVVQRASPPSTERVVVGTYQGGLSDQPTALVGRNPSGDIWERYTPGSGIHSTDTLVAMPGFSSIVQTRSGVALLLRGHLREFSVASFMNYLMDSAVILHVDPKFDLDMTLLRGRIYLTNRKEMGPATIRLRFESEVWDVTLQNPGDEILVDLAQMYTPLINYRKGEEPQAHCNLAVLRGEVGLRIDAFQTYNIEVKPPEWARMEWDSYTRTHGPLRETQASPALSKSAPSPTLVPPDRRDTIKRFQAALKNMETLFESKKALDVALKEMLERPDPYQRILAIYCLASIDALGPLVDVLGDEQITHNIDREAAFYSLQRFVARSPGKVKLLYDEKTGTGILIDKKYRKAEAVTVIQLLHSLLTDDLGKVETYEALARTLQNRKVAIAELGYWHLFWISGGAKLPPGFNAAKPQEEREKYAAMILDMIDKKLLPPGRPVVPEKTPPGKEKE